MIFYIGGCLAPLNIVISSIGHMVQHSQEQQSGLQGHVRQILQAMIHGEVEI